MSGLRAVVVKPIIIAAFVVALLASLAVGLTLSGGGDNTGGRPTMTEIELQSHGGPGRHRRCKPKGKYGKPQPPRRCRRRP